MRIDILSLFPAMFAGPFGDSIIQRAVDNGILDINITNPRDFAEGRHQQVDDTPFGGGSGMVMKPEPIFRAVNNVRSNTDYERRRIILVSPEGYRFDQAKAKELAGYDQLIIVCGHYEGFDARISENLADEIISVGDYVLTGGELPAMIITDAVARMLPGVLGSAESAPTDSFYNGLLEHPQYTRPREFEGMKVPEILFSGDHARIAKWRREKALEITLRNRPDLLRAAELTKEDREYLATLNRQDSES
ncbi:MAG: tRNA (guanosine(37)-N1)-methyltransferase TrmD [Anaerovibrio sp.]|uniref:tRNA (guanosine(37)-N1)-methyltransferase TrmD n=1 Tax=Anaerovibrio sp. TaxID=1872532 RepID=UPI0025FFC7E7|nr:tRNA (guanosine(37)-N1)-methyltransferase TrmD [Anaerovibrio sp.]MCR5175771.1 tRNA (guanosine(37)-N1)-methyltransferase TrmD [Anaerovibrio sp.]